MSREPFRGRSTRRWLGRIALVFLLLEIGLRIEYYGFSDAQKAGETASNRATFRIAAVGGSASRCYPPLLRAALQDLLPEHEVLVDSIVLGRSRTEQKVEAFEEYSEIHDPDIVIAMLGLQDNDPEVLADAQADRAELAQEKGPGFEPLFLHVLRDTLQTWYETAETEGWQRFLLSSQQAAPKEADAETEDVQIAAVGLAAAHGSVAAVDSLARRLARCGDLKACLVAFKEKFGGTTRANRRVRSEVIAGAIQLIEQQRGPRVAHRGADSVSAVFGSNSMEFDAARFRALGADVELWIDVVMEDGAKFSNGEIGARALAETLTVLTEQSKPNDVAEQLRRAKQTVMADLVVLMTAAFRRDYSKMCMMSQKAKPHSSVRAMISHLDERHGFGGNFVRACVTAVGANEAFTIIEHRIPTLRPFQEEVVKLQRVLATLPPGKQRDRLAMQLSNRSREIATKLETPYQGEGAEAYARLVELSRSEGFVLVAMGYPSDHPTSKTRKALPLDGGVTVVDNAALFERVLRTEKRRELFRRGPHLTPKGCGFLTRNLVQHLMDERLLPAKNAKVH